MSLVEVLFWLFIGLPALGAVVVFVLGALGAIVQGVFGRDDR